MALLYPEAVQQYLDEENPYGAILGPFSVAPDDKFHCSPMLTRPNDLEKRRVILNLSYPERSALNDNVGRLHFNGKKLKFPTIYDICEEICNNPTEVFLSKINIVRG